MNNNVENTSTSSQNASKDSAERYRRSIVKMVGEIGSASILKRIYDLVYYLYTR